MLPIVTIVTAYSRTRELICPSDRQDVWMGLYLIAVVLHQSNFGFKDFRQDQYVGLNLYRIKEPWRLHVGHSVKRQG